MNDQVATEDSSIDGGASAVDRRVGDADWKADALKQLHGVVLCRRCGGQMKPSKAIAQTYGGVSDFPNGPVVTMSPEGPGRLIDCLKCEKCGHSISIPNVELRGRAL